MAAIEKLSPELIGKIAAGEVVERPASVVKELVENAIDAGATHVTVEARGGGIEYLRISDNGKGIPSEQIRMAFERHATSKLQSEEQLFNVQTLGFRGEALASVAAVAKVTCTTKTADAPYGVKCVVEGGAFGDVRQAASPVGTTFVVEDLFFNTPVRRKFLKKPAVEAAAISDYMLRLILSHPEVSFRFASQGKTVYHSLGDGKLSSALYSLYGREAFESMTKIEGNQSGALISGYVGAGELSRGNRQQQSFFVNGRFFRNLSLSHAVESGCQGRVMIGKYPMCALFLQMPYQLVDVNVHPNKLEVRFQDEAAVAEAVRAVVSDAMNAEKLGERLTATTPQSSVEGPAETAPGHGITVTAIPNGQGEPGERPENDGGERNAAQIAGLSGEPLSPQAAKAPCAVEKAEAAGTAESLDTPTYETDAADGSPGVFPSSYIPAALPQTAWPPLPQTDVLRESAAPPLIARAMMKGNQAFFSDPASQPQNAAPNEPHANLPEENVQQTVLLPEEGPTLRLVGIVFDTYWIFQSGERLLLVDQHAAHERMLYDRILARASGDHPAQYLLSPRLVRLSPRDMALVDELQEVLTASGFQVEAFDSQNVAVHAVPSVFGAEDDPAALLTETLDEWQAGRGQITGERMRRQIAQMACKHAIKGGDKLNENQVQGFLAELLKSEAMPTCPHGRPIVVEVSRYALEKRFKRIQ